MANDRNWPSCAPRRNQFTHFSGTGCPTRRDRALCFWSYTSHSVLATQTTSRFLCNDANGLGPIAIVRRAGQTKLLHCDSRTGARLGIRQGYGTPPFWVAFSKVLSGLGNVTQLFLQHTFDDRGGMAQTGVLGSLVGRLDGFEDCK